MPQPSSVFLMYHEIELPNRQLCQSEPGYVRYVVALQEFRTQISTIQELGLRGVNVSQALDFAGPAVAITVDDGCETDLIAMAPILREFSFGATFYITTGFLGKPGYLSKAQLRELSNLGFEIGCHSMTHPYLSDLDDGKLRSEIELPKMVLQEIIGEPVEHFSCPGGRHDPRVSDVAKRAGFRTVADSTPRANSPSTDLFALGRVAITREIDAAEFQALCHGDALWRLRARVAIRDGAKRLLGNGAYDRIRALLLRA